MPRGVKGSGSGKPKKSIDEQIAEAEEKIAEWTSKKKALVATKKEKEKEEVAKIIADSDLSLDEIRTLLAKAPKE